MPTVREVRQVRNKAGELIEATRYTEYQASQIVAGVAAQLVGTGKSVITTEVPADAAALEAAFEAADASVAAAASAEVAAVAATVPDDEHIETVAQPVAAAEAASAAAAVEASVTAEFEAGDAAVTALIPGDTVIDARADARIALALPLFSGLTVDLKDTFWSGITNSGTQTAGLIELTANTGTSAAGHQCRVNFATPFATDVSIVLTPVGEDAFDLGPYVHAESNGAAFSLAFKNTKAFAGAEVVKVYWMAVAR